MIRRIRELKNKSNPMKIKLVGFDLDDTLWAVKPVIINAEKVLNAWLRERAPEMKTTVEEMRHYRDRVIRLNPNIVKQITEMRRQILRTALLESQVQGADQIADEAIEVFLEARNNIEFFDGALDALTTLSNHYELGALSNGNADIERIGLGKVFSFAYSAEQVGAPKPEPALFERAIAHVNIDPREMIYVGDDPALDVDAANRLGIKTIWLDHGTKPQGESEPNVTISDIKDLPEAVFSLDNR